MQKSLTFAINLKKTNNNRKKELWFVLSYLE